LENNALAGLLFQTLYCFTGFVPSIGAQKVDSI